MLKPKDIHLSSDEVAICAEAVKEKRFETLSSKLKAHLQECDQCSAEVALKVEIIVPQEDITQKQTGSFDWNHPAISLLIAAFVIGFIFLVIFPLLEKPEVESQLGVLQDQLPPRMESEHILSDNESSQLIDNVGAQYDMALQEPESSPNVQSDNILLAAFIPNPEMEMLVTNYQTAYRGNNITVITESSISFPELTSLNWQNSGGISLLIEIADNDGNEVVSISTDSNSIAIPKLKAGLYYWKLIDENDFDLIFVGKILYQP